MSDASEARKRDRERRARDYTSEKIPPEQRGKVSCPTCQGEGGFYTKASGALNAVFHGCQRCKLNGELTPEEAAKPWPPPP